MTWALIKHYSKTTIMVLVILAVVIISVTFASKNKKILELLKQLKLKKVEDDTKITEQKIQVNEEKINALKTDSNVSVDKIKSLEEQNASHKAKLEQNKNNIDELSKTFDSLMADLGN